MATKTAKKPVSRATLPKTVTEYLAAAPIAKRRVLMGLRKTIKAAAPKATELLSYGIVGYKYNGKALLYIGYAKDHCAIYGSTGHFVRDHASDLKAFDLSKGTIRFPAERPLPDALVRKLIASRIAEIEKAG